MNELAFPATNVPRLVIIGGGFAGLNLARQLRRQELQIILLDRNNYHTFQPLLYQVATAGLEPDSIAYPLRKVFNGQRNLIFRMAEVLSIEPQSNQIVTSIGTLAYDYLVIATGSETNYFGLKLHGKVVPMKSVTEALDLRSLILENFEQALLTNDVESRDELMTFVVVGGGPTGVETAGALAELKRHILPVDYPELDLRRMQIHLIEATGRLLGSMSDHASESALGFLKRFGVNIWLESPVTSYDGTTVALSGGRLIRAATVIWTAGVLGSMPAGVPAAEIIKGHRVRVDEFGRVRGFANLFAIGDVAAVVTVQNPTGDPMLAPAAIQQGRHLARNFKRLLRGESLVAFVYRDKGTMATVGRNRAVVDLPSLRFSGILAWFAWMYLHLLFLVGFRNKMVVLVNWAWNYFTYDRGVRLILRRFRRTGAMPEPAEAPVAGLKVASPENAQSSQMLDPQ